MTAENRMDQKKTQRAAVPRDRYAELLVVLIVAVSLVVAWGVKAGAESRAVRFENDQITTSYDSSWILRQPTPPEMLRIVDPASSPRFLSTITVSTLASAGGGQDVAQMLNQSRLLNRDLYQVIDGSEVEMRGRDLWQNDFAYVYTSPDLMRPTVPVVVHGVDYILLHGDSAYVVTCMAAESAFDTAMAACSRFMNAFSPH